MLKHILTKKMLVPILAVVIGSSALFGISQAVHAQSAKKPLSGLVQMIAQKFGLDQNQVQSVVDQYQQQQMADKQQKMQQHLESRLDKQVQQGKITAAQKQAILDELNNLKTKYNLSSLKNMTPQERQQALQNARSELQSWAKSQNIDLSLIPGFGMGRHMGMHGGWFKSQPTPTP